LVGGQADKIEAVPTTPRGAPQLILYSTQNRRRRDGISLEIADQRAEITDRQRVASREEGAQNIVR